MAIPQHQTSAISGDTVPNALPQETTSRFEWNGRTIGIAVGAGVLVIACLALGILINPVIFTPIAIILPFAWLLMDSPNLTDLLCRSRTITPEEQPLLGPRRQASLQSPDFDRQEIEIRLAEAQLYD
ncbi:MAG: hypothetical protein JSR39_07080 [Verrucomicrobia bacterium]|nr:hypothetical protein [Verrucomicrobiota bacterium]